MPETGGSHVAFREMSCRVRCHCVVACERRRRCTGQIEDRVRARPDRSACRQRQGRAHFHADLGRGSECARRPARPSGRTRLLRRSGQSGECAGHLREAARCRQGRPRGVGLWHQHDHAGNAARHEQGHDDDVADRPQRQRALQLRPLFPDRAARRGPRRRFLARLFRSRRGHESEAQDRGDSRRRRGIRPARAGGRTANRRSALASRSCSTGPIRPRPSISARSFGR